MSTTELVIGIHTFTLLSGGCPSERACHHGMICLRYMVRQVQMDESKTARFTDPLSGRSQPLLSTSMTSTRMVLGGRTSSIVAVSRPARLS